MRILAIRGENLASLYGTFELPLDQGPIAEVGLFSISGPTGSGKSTLVDALCLALFGETPRTGQRGRGVLIGREGDDPALLVDANDERDLVSRGTSGGHAEVEFEGVDGRRYRSRWSAHRARGQVTGKFQAVRVVVTDVDTGDTVAGTVRERDEAIPRLLGYSFDEFRRAVVLPQFEFTAFLKADAGTRADILERVTGTDIYSRISEAAFRRAAAETGTLDELDRKLGEVALLPDEERASLDSRAATLASMEEEARRRADVASGAVRWHDTDAANRDEVRTALADLEDARAREGAAGETRVELERVEQAEGLRGLHDEAARTRRELAHARERDGAAEAAVRDAEAASRFADEEARSASDALAEVEARAGALRPQLEEARRLDASVRETRGRLDEAAGAHAEAVRACSLAREEAIAAGRVVAEREAERSGAQSWLLAHAESAALAAEWGRWEATLRKHATQVTDIDRKESAARAAADGRATALARRNGALARVAGLEGDFGVLEQRARTEEERAGGDDLAALRTALAGASQAHASLKELADLASRVVAGRRDQEEAEAEIGKAEAERQVASRELAELEKQVIAAEAALDADRQSLSRTQEALSLEEHRERLADGEPCPVCGATEHPFARKAPTETLEKRQREAVASREKELKALQAKATKVETSASRADERAAAGRTLLEKHGAALAKATQDYAATREKAGLAGVPARPVTGVEKLERLLADAKEALDRAQEALDAALSRKQSAESARREVEARRSEVEQQRTRLVDAERALDTASASLERAEEDVRRETRLRDGTEAELDAPLGHLGDWRPSARADGVEFLRSCARVAADHAARVEAARGAEQALGPARSKLEGARATADAKEVAVDDLLRRKEGVERELTDRSTARAALLGGRSAAEVEAEQVGAVDAARKRADDARDALGLARVAMAGAARERSGAASRLSTATADDRAARHGLAEGLARAGLEAGAFAEFLTRGKAWVEATRQALADLAQARTKAESTHADRARRAEAHGRESAPALSRDEAERELAAAQRDEQAARTELGEVRFKLRADEEGRASAAGLARERDVQRKVSDRWQGLSALIGSSDGKKFRSFAQGLTLDALLVQANRRLDDLAPRYRLLRVPGQDLELQVVDRDLGDEVRSVNGLSGGESFLVSLALALALASVATRVSQSRTLFIDEGFGTLDRETLEHAMVALESLRASGRTVGVISHVPELHERIGVRVEVERTGVGRSRVVVPGS